jgi:redox-sensitive bicupin YhaK (pirin superfamily)
MTAGHGILHEEFHSAAFTRTGGPFRMVQLWVNLPAKDKMSPPGYQSILDADIPSVDVSAAAGRARIIAGDFQDVIGPARTFTPVNVWDLRLSGSTAVSLDLPEGHIAVLLGQRRRLGLEPMQARFAPHDQPHLGRHGLAEG